jgi:hypothetical protein
MSLDKKREERVRWVQENMPAEDMDPGFPYIVARSIRGFGLQTSPAGFIPGHFKAHSSIGGLPESLQKEE